MTASFWNDCTETADQYNNPGRFTAAKSELETHHLENLDLDIEELHPLPEEFYAYNGSLTTPPCSEGLRWFVFAEPDQLSSEQLDAITSVLPDNARPLQPLNEHELLLVATEE